MAKKFAIILLMFLMYLPLAGQNWNEIYYLENEAEYLLEEKNYEKAIELYQKILKEIPSSSFTKFKIGLAYLKTDEQKDKAILFLEEASENVAPDFNPRDIRETRTPIEGYLYLGLAYHMNNRLDDALSMYEKYKELITSDHYNYPIVTQYIESCKNAEEMIATPRRMEMQNMGNKINDNNPNFNAVFSGDGNTMVFTSYTRNYIDIYISKKNGDSWSSPKNITKQVSKKYYLKTSSLSYDGDELFLVTDDSEGNDIFVSYLEENQWVNAKKLHKTISHRKSNETHASLSKDGNTLYFTSDREGGYGGLDIYQSERNEKGKWNDPINLGPKINTQFNEETPFISPDSEYLFFSSQGHKSMGGFDVFYVDLENPEKVTNMGYPVNTTTDDLFFVPGKTLNTGYMARVVDDGQGKQDIYQLTILPDIKIKGEIYNLADGNIIKDENLEIKIFNKENNNTIKSLDINNGNFKFVTAPGTYQISILNNNFEIFEKQITIPDDYADELFVFKAELTPKTIEQELIAESKEDTISVDLQLATAEAPKQEIIENEEPAKLNVTEETSEKSEAILESKEPKSEAIEYYYVTSVSAKVKTYSVQLMALKTPVQLSYFKDLENISVTKYPDGFYRYTVGLTESYTEASQLKTKIHEKGYKDAYIRVNNIATNYTIQIMALINPVELTYFNYLSSISAEKSPDFYRYTIGNFNSYNEAKAELENIEKLGYEGAFIKKINKTVHLAHE